ncbi:MAG TPA: hypothetical protein VFI31_07670 [Pirellulales bacterium]|nr:hypothetical protein [Pirellulales bacterium]
MWCLATGLVANAGGCAWHHCQFEPGEAVGLRTDCDPHSARVYHRRPCCHGPFRDPRLPGPKIMSTEPAVPEMAAPGYFHPVPTYPVFGPHSEEPDGIETALQPLEPDDGSMSDESLPEPREASLNDDEEDEDEAEEQNPLRLAAPDQSVRQAGWKAARKPSLEEETPTRPCANCSVRFKQRTTAR